MNILYINNKETVIIKNNDMDLEMERLADNFIDFVASSLNEFNDETLLKEYIANVIPFYYKTVTEENFEDIMIGTFDNSVTFDEDGRIKEIIAMGHEEVDDKFYRYTVDYNIFPCSMDYFITTIYEDNKACCDLQFKKHIAEEIYGL